MYSTKFSTLRWAVASASLAFAAAGCALLEPSAEAPPLLPVGATWSNVQTNSGSFGSDKTTNFFKVTGVRDWQGRKVTVLEGTNATILIDATTNKWVTFLVKDKPSLSWDPPIGWDFPMRVGNKWATKHQFTIHSANRTVPLEVQFDVEAYEKVTVAAGTFGTFRVRTTDNMGQEALTWWSPDTGLFVKRTVRRTEKHPAGPGSQEQELVSQTIKQ